MVMSSLRQRSGMVVSMLGGILALWGFFALPFYYIVLGGQVAGPRTGGKMLLYSLMSPLGVANALILIAIVCIVILGFMSLLNVPTEKWERMCLNVLIGGTAGLVIESLFVVLFFPMGIGCLIVWVGYGCMWIGWYGAFKWGTRASIG